MYVLIEGHKYRENTKLVKELLSEIQDPIENKKGIVNYVGYFYNNKENIKDCVFVLPKVLLEGEENSEEKVFGKYIPENIISIKPNAENPLTESERNFIYELSVWIYKAIDIYEKTHGDSIVYKQHIAQIGKGFRHKTNTLLDIILELRRFNRENQNFFFFVLRNLHSGYNKINWTRTISTTTAIVQDNVPIYLRPVNKKRQINFDEELLVIFFSILNYIKETYGFKDLINCNFDLITGKQFETYLKGMGRTRLRQIRYKYFSDKALELWELCYAFFDYAYQVRMRTDRTEYLIVKNFNIVFEAIIDELIGDKDHPYGLKEQEDGKRIDHLYNYKELISEGQSATNKKDQIYYIGDSKYYKYSTPIAGKAFYKQFTYARNVIQWHLNLFGGMEDIDEDDLTEEGRKRNAEDKKKYKNVNLRDNLTEGYNIIPNFFISAKMDRDFNYTNANLQIEAEESHEDGEKKGKMYMQTHFNNRIFDRDTLLLFHYNVNFLYVLSLYARDNILQKANWREKVREQFRKEIQKVLNDKYKFYAMQARPGADASNYIREHFQDVLGKIYAPYRKSSTNLNETILSLALDKNDVDNNQKLFDTLGKYFYIGDCNLGEDPQKALDKVKYEEGGVFVKVGGNVLVGTIKGETYISKFENRVADMYYSGSSFPSTISLYNLRYFIPYIAEKGIKDVYNIVGIHTEHPDYIRKHLGVQTSNDNLRICFDIELNKELSFDDYQKLKPKDPILKGGCYSTTLDELSKHFDVDE